MAFRRVREHCQDGHPYDTDCMVCSQGYMRSKMAMRSPGDSKKAESYMHLLEGVNTDILHYLSLIHI